jgi:hypothetical protein
MLPVIVLPTHDHGLLHPDTALCQLKATLDQRPTEVKPFRIGMEDVDAPAILEDREEIRVNVKQELKESAIF